MRSLSVAVFVSLVPAALFASAELLDATEWCDEGQTDVCFQRIHDETLDIGWGYLFPDSNPDGSVPNELIGIYTAPSTVGWVGNSLGGGMLSSPLVIGWTHETTAMASLRYAEDYAQPSTWADNATLTILGGSGVTADGQQRIIWRCQGCTTWTSSGELPGGIDLDAAGPIGFAAHNATKPSKPSESDSDIKMHSMATIHALDVPKAKSADYWVILEKLQGLPQLSESDAPTASSSETAKPTQDAQKKEPTPSTSAAAKTTQCVYA